MRILLVDDHDLVRTELRHVIQGREDWEVCGEAIDGEDAVQKYSALMPNLTVMDFNMPLVNGLEASRQIIKKHPDAYILMLTSHISPQLEEEIQGVGIRGLCFKSDLDGFFDAMDAILRGETYFCKQPA